MKVSESTEFTLDIKTLVLIISFVITAAGMWFALQGDIEEAKRLPEPVVTRTEYDLKDKLIRETIMNTQQKVQENGEKLDLIEATEQLGIDERFDPKLTQAVRRFQNEEGLVADGIVGPLTWISITDRLGLPAPKLDS